MLLLIILIPALSGIASWFIPNDAPRRWLLLLTALVECATMAFFWIHPPAPMFGGVIALDALGKLVFSITSLIFLAASIYASVYLKLEDQKTHVDFKQKIHFTNAPEAVFTACLLLFLSAAALVAVSQHMGLLWVAIEATTLVTAPAIYFHRHPRSLEATWKYLIICSVGIALALLGNILLNVSMLTPGSTSQPLIVGTIVSTSPEVHPGWFTAAFIFIFIGYGTKMGIAPMHTWLPDAHSEAPSLVSALLSGTLLNGAFLGLLRMRQISMSVGMADLCNDLFILFGLASMLIAAMFIVGQSDYKRMLAYSSVEHMGILLLGVGIGSVATKGAMLHMIGHSLTKASLFLLAGNILTRYKSTRISNVTGLQKSLPLTAVLWTGGFLAITGSPPFLTFVSEFSILRGAVSSGGLFVPIAYLLLLGIIFVAMITALMRMCGGNALPGQISEKHEHRGSTIPSLVLLGFGLLLGIWVPGFIMETVQEAVSMLL